jgi:hypothetical protein
MRKALLALIACLISCGGATTPAESTPPESAPVAGEPDSEVGDPSSESSGQDSPAEPVEPETETPADVADPPPWSADRVAKGDVPKVYLIEHGKADNRATCPILVFTDVGEGAGARPRRANFHGGWAVAYDKKGLPGTHPSGEDCTDCGRGAYGIAGAGVSKGGGGPPWPHELLWSDGSKVGYGPEGGTGKRQLAFLEASDADCLYNIWSALGEQHLLQLLGGLRRVADQ